MAPHGRNKMWGMAGLGDTGDRRREPRDQAACVFLPVLNHHGPAINVRQSCVIPVLSVQEIFSFLKSNAGSQEKKIKN